MASKSATGVDIGRIAGMLQAKRRSKEQHGSCPSCSFDRSIAASVYLAFTPIVASVSISGPIVPTVSTVTVNSSVRVGVAPVGIPAITAVPAERSLRQSDLNLFFHCHSPFAAIVTVSSLILTSFPLRTAK